MKRWRCCGWALAAVLGLVLVAPGWLWAQQPKSGGTLRVAWEADITGLDPHTSSGLQAQRMVGNLFNSLVTIDAHLNYIPELAESWEVKDGGKTYVFHLRQGVKFHDGTDFDAEAVKFNFLRITARLDPEEKPFAAPFFTAVESVEPLDAHTVQFNLKSPTYTLIPALGVYRVGFLQMSPTSYKTYGKREVHQHPAGTGPFRFAKWEQNSIIVLEKNPTYFKQGLPYLDRIEFKIMKEGVTRATALRAREVDFVTVFPREHASLVAKDPKIHLYRGVDTANVFIPFNTQRKPFDNPTVRIALMGHGIDRDAIAKAALLGYGKALWSGIPEGSKDHVDFPDMYPYNPDRAKALLKEAGFDEKNPLKYTLMTHPADPALPTIATIIKTQLAKIGVDVTLEVVDRPIFLRRLTTTKEYDQVVNFSSQIVDPFGRAFVLDSRQGANVANHKDAQVDALLDRLALAPTAEEFSQLGRALQEYLYKHMIYMSATSLPSLQAARDDVKGYVYERGFKVRFETTWLDK
ncbi:MAG: ABC transporter substrate-binding protein [Nitrospinae bacterium]|nr:ABC transporter substrate-binding protein [Nitrospinota bacterium]